MKNWLKFTDRVKKKYPAAAAHLNEKAGAGDIETLEQRFGHTLPQAFRDLYEINNGEKESSPGVIFGIRFLPIHAIIDELNEWQEVIRGGLDDQNEFCTSKPKGAIQCVYANKNWLPLFSDSGGNHIGLDFDPAAKGTIGQVINFGRDEEGKHVLAKDLATFITQLSKLVDSKVVQEEGDGGFSVNEMHFIDAIKDIKNLPSKNPENGYDSVWICPGGNSSIPKGYFGSGRIDGYSNGRSFLEDFKIQRKEGSSPDCFGVSMGMPAPLATLLKNQDRSKKYLAALQEDALKLGIAEAEYIHVLTNHIYTPNDGIPQDACVTFIGCYKV
jgi:cell wall assembly regulator SMI1